MALTINTELRSVKAEFTVNSYNSGNQLAPDALGLANGGFVVANTKDNLTDGSIHIDFYDANYDVIGSTKFPYEGTHTDARGEPSLTQLANGNVLVVWDDDNEANGDGIFDAGLKAAIFDQTGNLVRGEFDVAGVSIKYSGADVTALANGNFVVASGYDGVFNEISFRMFDAAGNSIGGEHKVNQFDDGTQKQTQVTSLSTGGFVVTWLSDDADGSPVACARVYNANGAAVGNQFPLSTDCSDMAITGLKDGGFAVVMREDASNYDLKVAVVNADGTVLNWMTTGWDPAHSSSQPDITQLDSGHILVTWTHAFSASDHDIYGSLFDAAGNHVAVNGQMEFVINASATDDIKSSVTGMLGGEFLTAWQDSDPHGGTGTSISGEINEFVGVVHGDNAADTYEGTGLRDEIEGGGGKDFLSGAGGDDFIDGGSGNDILNGGAGHDTVYGGIDNDIISGAVGNDASTWMEGDELYGEDGDDTIIGYWGDDRIDGGAGKDLINAGNGDDTIVVEKGDVVAGEQYDGGDGADTLYLSAINVPSTIDFSNASLFNIETIKLGGVYQKATTFIADADQFWGQNESMIIDGHNGQHDTFVINMGATTKANFFSLDMQLSNFPGSEDVVIINGDGDAETIRGTSWADTIYGNGGADTIYAGNNDKIFAGEGADTMFGGFGQNLFNGENGIDTVSYAQTGAVKAVLDGSMLNQGDAASDSYVSIENLIGSAKNDYLFGTGGSNVLDGGLGNDTLYGGDGADKLIGGEGKDTANYSGAAEGVIASLANAAINTGYAEGDTYSSIENISGTKFDDSVYGNNSENIVNGGAGDDIIKGYAGNDILTGGSGGDMFVFNSVLNAATNVDVITDFDVAADTIWLENVIFTKAGSEGTLASGAFYIGAAAHDASDRIIYDSATGHLSYDADGNGAGAAVQFASLDAGLTLTNADFLVI